MKCPSCQRENETSARFCIYCGTPLPQLPSEQPEPLASVPIPRPLEEQVSEIREMLVRTNDRLARVERILQQAPPTSTLDSPRTYPPGTTPASYPPPLSTARKSREWEQILGGNWLARVGILAVILGVAFFVKFAFDTAWLGPWGRVALVAIVGLGLLAGGYYWRNRYPVFSQAFNGGCIALFYVAIFAASATFKLLDFLPTVILLFLVSAGAAGLALRYNSMALAIIGILGAFIAPFILTVTGATPTGAATSTTSGLLLAYVMILDIGVLGLSTYRNWRWFTLLSLVGSLSIWIDWYDKTSLTAGLFTALGSLTLIFFIFVGATMLYHVVWRRRSQAYDYGLMILNATTYFAIGLAILGHGFHTWNGSFSFLLALFYGGLYYACKKRVPDNVNLRFFALGIALTFLTIAIPMQIGDKAWTTIAWAAQGAILLWLSLKTGILLLRSAAYTVFAVMAGRLLFYDTTVDVRSYSPILNERALAFAVGVAVLYWAGFKLRRETALLRIFEKKAWSVYPVFIVAANFMTVWLLSAEVFGYFTKYLALSSPAKETLAIVQSIQNLSLSGLWAIYAAGSLVLGIVRRWRRVRLFALGALGIPILKVFVYDVFTIQQLYRIIAFVGLGIVLLVSGYLYQRFGKSIRGFIVSKK